MSCSLVEYYPPTWAKKLQNVPKYRVELAHSYTPIHKWTLPGIPPGITVHIKRDDMTGSTLSGNKVRKLEYLFADALKQGCRHVITCGNIQSNHCRAVAVTSRQLGLTPHLILREDKNSPNGACEGNALLYQLAGAHTYSAPAGASYLSLLKPMMEELAQKIRSETAEDSYLIPVGGSNEVGLFGYISAFEEMIQQGLLTDFDDIVVACGTAGTAVELGIANYLTGSKLRCHAVVVVSSTDYIRVNTRETLAAAGLSDVRLEDIVDVIDGYHGAGYGVTSPEERDFLIEVSKSTGIILDPVYTVKAARAMVQELRDKPHRFKGSRILFIHTGGLFGLFDGRMKPEVTKSKRIELRVDKGHNHN